MGRIIGEYDPRVLSDDDFDMGGFIPTPDNPATPIKENLVRHFPNRMAGPARDRLAQGQIKARMAALYRHGVMYVDICTIINREFGLEGTEHEIKPRTIAYHMKEMIGYWREKSLAHIDERQAMTLLRYDQIEQLATEAWFKSCQGRTVKNYERQINRVNSKVGKDENMNVVLLNKDRKLLSNGDMEDTMLVTADKIKHYSREEDSAGDPRFLAIMIDINHKRAQLWGLLNKGEQSTSDQELARLSDDARTERIASVIAQAKARATGDIGNLAPATPLGGFKDGEEPAEELKADPPPPTNPIPVMAPSSPMTLPDEDHQTEVDIDDLEWD